MTSQSPSDAEVEDLADLLFQLNQTCRTWPDIAKAILSAGYRKTGTDEEGKR